jgi:hypothetical protein
VTVQAGRGGQTVANSKSDGLHAAAACLRLAQRTADTTMKMKLIDMAQFWINTWALDAIGSSSVREGARRRERNSALSACQRTALNA